MKLMNRPYFVLITLFSFCLSALFSVKNYISENEVYFGHFGRSLEYDWAMKPWYKFAFLALLFLALCSIFSTWYYKRSKFSRAYGILFFCMISTIIIIFLTEVAMPYWYKNVSLLNYGQGA